jgi:hypothetical protein
MVFVAGGAWVLSSFTAGGVAARQGRGSKSLSQRQFDLEEEHRKIQEQFGEGKEFRVVRIPRPGDPNEKEKEQG